MFSSGGLDSNFFLDCSLDIPVHSLRKLARFQRVLDVKGPKPRQLSVAFCHTFYSLSDFSAETRRSKIQPGGSILGEVVERGPAGTSIWGPGRLLSTLRLQWVLQSICPPQHAIGLLDFIVDVRQDWIGRFSSLKMNSAGSELWYFYFLRITFIVFGFPRL